MEREYDYDKAPDSLIAAINEAALGAVNRVFKMLALRKVKVQLDEGAFMPERAHDTDAGADIRTPVSLCLPRGRATPSTLASTSRFRRTPSATFARSLG